MTLMLLISSTFALALLVVHSWRTRGRTVTLVFFIAAALFGLLRGNAIWLLVRCLGETAYELKPYVPQGGLLPEVGHASIQVALGWVFALYLAWTVSERILRRLPRFTGRVFMVSGLASVFMLAMCYGMETTAVSVGWWYWTLPTRSALFGSVNVWAMEGWFSVVPDFLIPFLVIVCADTRRRRLKWLWVLVFPLHLSGHLMYRWFTHAYLVYNVMELAVVVLMMFGGLRMGRGEIRPGERGGGKVTDVLPGVALAIFFLVLMTATLVGKGGVSGVLTLVPMLMLCLLAWRRVPVTWVTVLSLAGAAGWWWIGARAFWVLVPVGVYGFLRLHERLGESLLMKLVPPAVQVALTLWVVVLFQRDTARIDGYVRAWLEGDRRTLAGESAEAVEAYRRADQLRPESTLRFHQVLQRMTRMDGKDPRETAVLFQHRTGRLVRELEELTRRDPEWVEPRMALARFHLLLGDLHAAADQYRQMLRLRPRDANVMSMLGYLLLREGKVAEAEELCTRVLRLRKPPAAAAVNLGVIRFHQNRTAEARTLWQLALSLSPEHPVARLNLQRPTGAPPDAAIDTRYLARPTATTSREVAGWTNTLAAYGRGYSEHERVRLLLEATQFDPDCLLAHMNLVNVYLGRGSPLRDVDRALWHARRAVTIAGQSHGEDRQAESLLLLGQALKADGKPEAAREVLEKGRTKAPAARRPVFDRLLGELGAAPP